MWSRTFFALAAVATVAAAEPFATSVIDSSPLVAPIPETNLFGAPDGLTAGFDNVGSSPWFVTLGFGPAMIVDGPGADLAIHVLDFFTGEQEQYRVFASSDGVSFILLGTTFPTTSTPNLAQTFSYDLAGSGLASASAVRLVGLVVVTANPFEGADIDSVEILNAAPIPEPLPLVLVTGGLLAAATRRRKSADDPYASSSPSPVVPRSR